MKNYWLVGAMFGGSDDYLSTFIKRGYWYCWEPDELIKPNSSVQTQQDRFKNINIGDRLAVKKLLGRGSKEIEIRAIGTVTDIDLDEWRIYVNWLPIIEKNQNRRVPIKGCTASIHGPFKESDPWVNQVFCA